MATGANYNWKEKLFISIAWIPKATVQVSQDEFPRESERNEDIREREREREGEREKKEEGQRQRRREEGKR